MMSCYAKRLQKILSLVVISYGCEDLDLSVFATMRLEMTDLSAYHFAYLNCCQADPTACGLDEDCLINTINLISSVNSHNPVLLPGPFLACLSLTTNE